MAASNSNRRARRKLRPTCYTRSTLNVSLLLVFSVLDRKSTRLNSSHLVISYAVFCLKKKKEYLSYRLREHGKLYYSHPEIPLQLISASVKLTDLMINAVADALEPLHLTTATLSVGTV